ARGEQVVDRPAAALVAPGRHHAARLVQGQDHHRGRFRLAAAARHRLAVQVHPGERVGDHAAVHADLAGPDPVPGLAARAPAALGRGPGAPPTRRPGGPRFFATVRPPGTPPTIKLIVIPLRRPRPPLNSILTAPQ